MQYKEGCFKNHKAYEIWLSKIFMAIIFLDKRQKGELTLN